MVDESCVWGQITEYRVYCNWVSDETQVIGVCYHGRGDVLQGALLLDYALTYTLDY